MRITEIDLQCEELTWFAVDRCGHILVCYSGGCGNVPEFICRSREETEQVESYFANTQPVPLNHSGIITDAVAWAERGLFCYDVDMDHPERHGYHRVAVPEHPAHYFFTSAGDSSNSMRSYY